MSIKCSKRDYLAKDRTHLANERTFLAYIRTSLAFFALALFLIKFFFSSSYVIIAILLIIFGFGLVAFGAQKFVKYKKEISQR